MLDALQRFLQMDAATGRFFGVFLTAALVLTLASLAFDRFVAKPEARPADAGPRTRGPRPPIVVAAVAFAQGFIARLAALPISANQITVIGLLLVVFNCSVFALSGNTFWFGSGLISALLFDMIDGSVARAQGRTSKLGGYLDAMIDRYQEVLIYLTLGAVLGQWLPVFLIITGSMLTSYAKARVALEIETDNKGWPDLLEKPMRLFILCVGLIGAPVLPWFLPVSLWILAVLTHVTALQRFARACFIIHDSEARAQEAAPRS